MGEVNKLPFHTVALPFDEIVTLASISDSLVILAGNADSIPVVASFLENFDDTEALLVSVQEATPQITTVAGIAADVTTVAGIAADVTIVAGFSDELAAGGPLMDGLLAAVAATETDALATTADREATEQSASDAATSATQAEAARDAATVNADAYADIATGRAAVADGVQFQVVTGDEIIRYRRDSASTQTEVARYPSKSLVDSVAEDVQGGNAAIPGVFSVGGQTLFYSLETGQVRFVEPLDAADVGLATIAEDIFSGASNAGVVAAFSIGETAVEIISNDGQRLSLADAQGDEILPTSAFADGTQFQASRNEMWSQWVWPRTIENEFGTAWWGSVSKAEGDRAGPFTVGRRRAYGGTERHVVGLTEVNIGSFSERGNVDDHNRPSVIYNPWPDAAYPLQAIQADHGERNYGRAYRSTTDDPRDLTLAGLIQPAGGGAKTYGQYFFKPDAPAIMRGTYRDGGFTAASWALVQRNAESDLPTDWTYLQNLFVGAGLYIVLTPTLAGDGLWLTSYLIPSVAGTQKITLSKILWDWSLVHPDGTVIHADLRTQSNLNPLSDAGYLEIFAPGGTDRLRLFDVREYPGDDLRAVFAQFPSTGKSTTGDYKIASVNLATSAVTVDTICACGGKIEEEATLFAGQFVRAANTSSYIAGAALTDRPNEVFCTRWFNTYGDAVFAERQAANDWALTTVDYSTSGKIARPEGHVRIWWDADASVIREEITSRISYWRGSGPHNGYSMFYDFNADRVTVDLTTYRSNWK